MFCSSILTSAERLQITSKTQDDKLEQIQDTAKENQHQDLQMTSPNFNNKRIFSGSHNNSGISPLIQKNKKRLKNTGNPHDHNNNGSTKANTSQYTNSNTMIPKEIHPPNETQTLSLNKVHIEQNQLPPRSPLYLQLLILQLNKESAFLQICTKNGLPTRALLLFSIMNITKHHSWC